MKQALYRKYRPKNFTEIYGQDNIVNILKNQIKNNKISHAYIFSGTRGTGKTSTAKILSKAVNCLTPIDGSPCNECNNCLLIQSEKSMDIVEMDAASNRRIDDIRQLRDQVIYPPNQLKYKVYIIDEAHMITNEGFNALLKIMEEPPEYLIFILATTELEKIPNTILSRTQRFEFKSLSIENIKKQIRYILNNENIVMEDKAIEVIANVASGAMRDALSVLDQVISIGKEKIATTDVYDLLGIFSEEIKLDFCKYVFIKDIKNLLILVDNELEKGKDSNNFVKEIVKFFQELIYIKIGAKESDLTKLVKDISLEQLINSVDILLEYENLMKKSDSSELLFKVASVRLLDYMPRKKLEAKINNLEERLLYLEKNSVIENDKLIKVVKKEETNNTNIEEIENLLEKYDNDINSKEEYNNDIEFEEKEESNIVESNIEVERISNEILEKNHIDLLKNILKEKYSPTNILMKNLKKEEKRNNIIIFYFDSKDISMSLGMNFFFKKAKEDLEKKTGILYEIKFEVFEDFDDNESKEKINKLKQIFSKDKLVIKEKK